MLGLTCVLISFVHAGVCFRAEFNLKDPPKFVEAFYLGKMNAYIFTLGFEETFTG